jgi:alpha-L-rhamnosidase
LAGIDTDGPGFRRILIRPMPPSPDSNPERQPVSWVKAEHRSLRGRIVSAWKRDGNRFSLEATIPANTTATVMLPARGESAVSESGRTLGTAPGVKFLRMEDGRAVMEVQSGTYRFASQVAP